MVLKEKTLEDYIQSAEGINDLKKSSVLSSSIGSLKGMIKKSPEKDLKKSSIHASNSIGSGSNNIKSRTVMANVSPTKKPKIVVKDSLDSFKLLKDK